MSRTEVYLINALCKTKDYEPIFTAGADKMFTSYGDVFNTIVKHHQKYKTFPTIELLREDYPDLYEVEADQSLEFYIDEMRDQWIERKMRDAVQEARDGLSKGGASMALNELINDLNVVARTSGTVRDVDVTQYQEAIEDFKARRDRLDRTGSLGIMSGIKPFDVSYPTGMAGGHFIVVIGWSGYGKTAFSTYLACQAWRQGYTPMIVSLEMSAEEMRDRIYTTLGDGEFNHRNITRGEIDIDTFETWGEANLDKPNEFIVVSGEGFDNVTLNTVQAKIDQYKPDLVILDYLQLFEDGDGGNNETTKIRNISKGSKRLAIRNNIPVIGITQATQDNKSDLDEPPLIEQVAWSKGIQHDADLAIAPHRPPGTDEMTILARKNRHGQLFMFYLTVDMENGRWTEHYGPEED